LYRAEEKNNAGKRRKNIKAGRNIRRNSGRKEQNEGRRGG
jgi:hypothetical protein